MDVGDTATTLWNLRFDPIKQLVHATRCHGKILQTIGTCIDGEIYLSIPEAVFLLEIGRATTDDSLLQSLLLDNTTDAMLKAYFRLKRMGYILTDSDRKVWNVHLPDSSFKKSNPTRPLCHLSFVDYCSPVITSADRVVCTTDSSSTGIFFKTQWTSLNPFEPDESDNIFPPNFDDPL